MTAINQTTKMMGMALRQARTTTYISRSEAAKLLKISRVDLTRYENGEKQLPTSIMQMMFANAYLILYARYITKNYCNYAKRLHEMGELDIPDEDIFDDAE